VDFLIMAETYIFTGRSGCGKGTQAALLIAQKKKRLAAEASWWVHTHVGSNPTLCE
jgi:adenylate kinase family enzyme